MTPVRIHSSITLQIWNEGNQVKFSEGRGRREGRGKGKTHSEKVVGDFLIREVGEFVVPDAVSKRLSVSEDS